MAWRTAIIAIFAPEILRFGGALWPWPPHPKSYHSPRSISACVKNLKIIFVSDSGKAWSGGFTACCFQYREPDPRSGDWQLTAWQGDRIRVLLYLLSFYSLYVLEWRRCMLGEIGPNNRDLRRRYIGLRNLLGFLLPISSWYSTLS